MEKYFQHTMVTGIAPAFYKSSKKASKSKIIRWCSRILQKYGVIINAIILHLITLLIYSSMGAILRNTVFPYNIKKKYGINDDNIQDYFNDTMKLSETGTNQEIQNYLNQLLFIHPLHNFPSQFVGWYIVCIVIYVLLSAIYYRAFHPWKNIILEKKTNEHKQEVKRKCSQQDHDELSTDVEISHL